MSTPSTTMIQPRHIAGVAAGLGALLSLNSTYAVLSPRAALSQLGFPNAISPSDQKLTEGIIRMYGGVRITMGASQLVAWYLGNHTIMAYNLLLGVIVAGVDGYVPLFAVYKRRLTCFIGGLARRSLGRNNGHIGVRSLSVWAWAHGSSWGRIGLSCSLFCYAA